VKRPSEPRGRVRFLDEEERNRLLATCEESRTDWLYGLVVTALCTGARQAELLNLKWADIDLERGLGVIHHSKNGERRALAITGLAEKVLRERNRGREDRRFVFGNGHRRPAFPQAAWKKALIEAEIEDFRFHDVRHTFASYLAMSGATLAELAEALGHRSLMMVKRYAHLTEGHTANVVARMTERFMAV
jgi:integrase